MRWLWLLIGLSGALAVTLGAIGAHGLPSTDAALLASHDLAVRYHLLHTVTAALALILADSGRLLAALTAALFLTAIVFFSGSIYLESLAITQLDIPIAPVGGVGFILGWLMLGICGWHAARDLAGEWGE